MNDSRGRSRVKGRAVPLPGDDMDTDRIIPARFMKSISFEKLGRHVFHDERFGEDGAAKGHPFDDPRFAGARILVVGSNFGCGSSREHAPQALLRWGIEALVGESFSEIFSGNCTALGMPAVRVGRPELDKLFVLARENPESELEIDLEANVISVPGEGIPCGMPEGDRLLLVTGQWDTTGMLLGNIYAIRGAARRIPYLNGFRGGLHG